MLEIQTQERLYNERFTNQRCRKQVIKQEGAKDTKNENGVEIRTTEEIVTAFRKRLMKTFNINEEYNELFCERTEREVEEWIGGNRERLNPKERVVYEDTPEISPSLVEKRPRDHRA